MTKIIIGNRICDIKPGHLASEFFQMDSDQQAEFFSCIAFLADKYLEDGFNFKAMTIGDSEYLSDGGRGILQMLGEYSESNGGEL